MSKRFPNTLALIPPTPNAPRAKVLYTSSDHAPEYVVGQTALGEFAMHWTADWLTGFFSVTDLPPEWVAFVQSTLNGGSHDSHEAVYDGEAPFSLVVWEMLPWDDRIDEWVFSQELLEAADRQEGMLGNVVDAMRAVDVRTWGAARKRLPFHRTLALPDSNGSTP
jgi:hypothetical protein